MPKWILLPLCVLLLSQTSCERVAFRRAKPKELGKHLTMEAKETPALSDREYLMRKATVGSRSERLEALDVIERAADPAMFPFLMERLDKEDDRFLRIKIMHALAAQGDVRAVSPLRKIARWDETRVGVEATAALYELGDDTFLPRLIQRVRPDSENPELAGISHRALKRMTGEDLPMSVRAWTNWYLSHRLTPYQARTWYWPFRQPLPPTKEGSTKIVELPKGKRPLPKEDVRLRRTHVTWQDWWKDEN